MRLRKRLLGLGLVAVMAICSIAYGADVYTTDIWDGGSGTVSVTGINFQVKGSAGVLYGVRGSFSSFTTGDYLEFKDALTNTGTSKLRLYADDYNSTMELYTIDWSNPVGIEFGTGIFCTLTQTSTYQVQLIDVIYK